MCVCRCLVWQMDDLVKHGGACACFVRHWHNTYSVRGGGGMIRLCLTHVCNRFDV